jgi:hypothetical protein
VASLVRIAGAVLFVAVATLAQAADADGCRRSLDEALSNHGKSVGRLAATRGLPDYAREGRASLAALPKDAGTVLLLFDAEGERICGHVVEAGQAVLRYEAGTVAALDRLEAEFRAALKIDTLQAARGPAPARGLRVVSAAASVAARSPAEAGANLGRAMFPAPVASRLEGKQRLLLVPTMNLGTLPYAALQPEGWNATLVERLAHVVLPNLFHRPKAEMAWSGLGGDRALVLGNPDLSRHAEWRFPALPGAEKEARHVASRIPGWAYYGENATRAAMLQHLDANVVYIASHGISDPRNPLDGGFIALADELVTPREIQSLHFRRDPLVVLSACQTGLGMAHEGGMIGLARAFQAAGAFGVVMSLWSVDDDATFFLMSRFVEELDRATPDEALRRATLAARSRFASPALWASFSYFGAPVADDTKR